MTKDEAHAIPAPSYKPGVTVNGETTAAAVLEKIPAGAFNQG